MRTTGEIFWLLACGSAPLVFGALPSFFPPSSPLSRGLAEWEVVSSYSSATASESHGIPSHRLLSLNSQRTEPRVEQRAAACSKTNLGASAFEPADVRDGRGRLAHMPDVRADNECIFAFRRRCARRRWRVFSSRGEPSPPPLETCHPRRENTPLCAGTTTAHLFSRQRRG